MTDLAGADIFASFPGPGIPADARQDGPDWITAWPRGSNGRTFRSAAVLVRWSNGPTG